VRKPDQSGGGGEINAEVKPPADFHQLLDAAGVFSGPARVTLAQISF